MILLFNEANTYKTLNFISTSATRRNTSRVRQNQG